MGEEELTCLPEKLANARMRGCLSRFTVEKQHRLQFARLMKLLPNLQLVGVPGLLANPEILNEKFKGNFASEYC